MMDLRESGGANDPREEDIEDDGAASGDAEKSRPDDSSAVGSDDEGHTCDTDNARPENTDNPKGGDSNGTASTPEVSSTSSRTPAPTAAPPKLTPRLLITKMEMENFKSYGGLREIGPFHKCFSSIVGPNGSGKSNVIDAMLFVFGKRAKKLRLNKVSELIHRSDTFPNLDFARVSVHFVDILDVAGSEDDYTEASIGA